MQRISRISRWWIAWGAAVAGAAAAIVGCGPDRPKMTPVTGTVTLSGKPLEGVAVMFVSKGGRPAHGTTDASGRFTLGTFEASDGALVGEHTVVFSKVVPVHPGAVRGGAGQCPLARGGHAGNLAPGLHVDHGLAVCGDRRGGRGERFYV